MRDVHVDDLTVTEFSALNAARRTMDTAYNPYSRFYVGAALWREKPDGHLIIVGSNCENAAYGSCICAERAAILAANSRGFRNFDGIAIIARGENFETTQVTGPCGSCRQMLYELMQVSGNNDLKVLLSTTAMDKITITTIRELLPLAFGPLDLGMDITRYRSQI